LDPGQCARMNAPGKLAQARGEWSNDQHDQLNKSDTD
jgi:hypothetical protein